MLKRCLLGFGLVLVSVGCHSTVAAVTVTPATLVTATPEEAATGLAEFSTPRGRDDSAATPPETVTPELGLTPSAGATSSVTGEVVSCQGPGIEMLVDYVNSSVLARRVPYSLYLPPCYESEPNRLFPVLYLLHGANADQTQWPDLQVQSDADTLIEEGSIAPLVVVMPGGDYLQGEDYGSFVLRDLIPHIEETLHVARDSHHRAIGGISQGGYLALDLALANPGMFTAVGAHSPATDSTLTRLAVLNRISEVKTLRIFLDVGDADPLAPSVEEFAAALEAQGLAPVFHIYPGAHNRPYWRSHTREYLMFYAGGW